MKKLFIYDAYSKEIIAVGKIGKEIREFNDFFFVKNSCVRLKHYAPNSTGFNTTLGYFERLKTKSIPHGVAKIKIPSIAFILGWRCFAFDKNSPFIIYESMEMGIPYERMAPSLIENEIASVEPGDKKEARIHNLVDNYFTYIESREDNLSHLYKDPKDERFWQLIKIADIEKLVHVTHSQWIYFYLERREGQQSYFNNSTDFYEALEIDPLEQTCQEEGCQALKVKYSSLCRDHHFEAVTGKSYGE